MLAALIGIPASAGAQAADPLTDAVLNAVKASRAPGAAVAVMRDGTVTFESGFGVRDIGTKAPVDVHTRFEIGSITKQFTAAAILQLKEQGKLALSDPLGKYVPQYAPGKAVTLAQLLGQVSGIPNYTDANHFLSIATHPASLNAVLALIKGKSLEFKPGTKWAYSNTNYYLLGRVVEAASGTTWESYVRAHIFVPAGMTESTFATEESGVPDMATGYELQKGKFVPAQPLGAWAYAAGAIVSTAGDLLKWDRALFGGKLISAADLQLMTQAGRLPSGKSTRYGFGWIIGTHDGTTRISHGGGTFGFAAENDVYPKLGEAVVALQNSSDATPTIITARAFDVLNPQLAQAETKAASGEDPNVTARVKAVWAMFVSGNLDRSQLDAGMNKAITPQVLAAAGEQFKTVGTAQTWVYRGKKSTPQYTTYVYLVTFSSGAKLNLTMSVDKDGKIAGFFAAPG